MEISLGPTLAPENKLPVAVSLPTLSPSRCGDGVGFEKTKILVEQDFGQIVVEIPDLELSAASGNQQSSFPIPIRPLQFI